MDDDLRRIWKRWSFGARAAEAQFEEWCKAPLAATTTFAEDQTRGAPDKIATALTQLTTNPGEAVSIQGFPYQWADLIANAKCQFTNIHESPSSSSPRHYKGIRVKMLQLAAGEVTIEDCTIGELRGANYSPITDLVIRNSVIGKMGFNDLGLRNLDWHGGYLGRMQFGEVNPFRGDVALRAVRLPSTKESHGLQWLRDARSNLNERNNALAAAVFHASELALSRPGEPPVNRLASWIYQWGSNFGNSLGRPVGWFVATLGAIFVLALLVGTEANVDAAIGWHHALRGDCFSAKALRAGIYAMQSIFNPLNLIVPRPLVSVSHWAAALGSFVLGLGGVVAFALFLLSLRRRFKLE